MKIFIFIIDLKLNGYTYRSFEELINEADDPKENFKSKSIKSIVVPLE